MLKKRRLTGYQSILTLVLLTFSPANAHAQEVQPPSDPALNETADDTEVEDEVISFGRQILEQHDGMAAFFRGDFETAEIEFEREFRSLKRFESARENAARDAELSSERAANLSQAVSASSTSISGPSGGSFNANPSVSLSGSSNITSNFMRKRAKGKSVLLDGKVTYQDFGFTRYMSGLSEIKLAKYDEAYKSLKTSLRYTPDNYDARFRLGLLELKKRDFEGAADQLEKLSKMRQKCIKLNCDDLDGITDAAVELAEQISGVVQTG